MRALWISTLALVLLVGAWVVFNIYSGDTLQELGAACEGPVLQAIKDAKWEDACAVLDAQQERWQEYKPYAMFFLDTQMLGDIDEAFVRARMYILAEDISNSSGELLALRQRLKFLHEREAITWQNII